MDKGISALVIIVIAIATIGIIVFTQIPKFQQDTPSQEQSQPPQGNTQPPQHEQTNQQSGITVKFTGANYKTVSTKPTGWFATGQDADVLLSGIGFDDAGGSLLFNHPGTVATDGTHLFLADRNNNRILIWNTLPTGNTPPDLVLGQKDFNSNNPGTGLDQMNWPVSVSVGGGKLVVTDTENYRILVWNSIPTKNGQPADLVLNSGVINGPTPGFDKKRSIVWPWGVWTDGKKLAVTSTQNGIILLWNNFPTQNDQSADIYLTGQGNIGTPRTITSDGTHLIVGDHNSKVTTSGAASSQTNSGNFFWKNWPASDDQPYDFFMTDPSGPGYWMQGSFTSDGKLILLGDELYVWNSFPQNSNDQPYVSVGARSSGQSGYKFIGGDGSGLAISGNRIYVSLSNGNKIVGFNNLPTSSTAKPDFAIGSPDINTNTLETNFIMSNPVPATDGKSLFVSSDFDSKLYVYKNLPDESNAHPDIVYSLPDAPWSNALFGNTLVLAGKKSVFVWSKLPLNGEVPDITFTNKIGDVRFQDLKGVAIDSKYFYLSDESAGKIYVWEGVPSTDSNPKFTIDADKPGRLSSDGNYLVDAAASSNVPGGSVRVYKISDLSSNPSPTVLSGFNLPQGATVYQGHLFVGGTGVEKVFIWKNIEDAIAKKDADVILGSPNASIADPYTLIPEIGKNKLFMPSNLAFDGSYLWVGEFKFSERLLRFSVS